jgi:hypothetical protein
MIGSQRVRVDRVEFVSDDGNRIFRLVVFILRVGFYVFIGIVGHGEDGHNFF